MFPSPKGCAAAAVLLTALMAMHDDNTWYNLPPRTFFSADFVDYGEGRWRMQTIIQTPIDESHYGMVWTKSFQRPQFSFGAPLERRISRNSSFQSPHHFRWGRPSKADFRETRLGNSFKGECMLSCVLCGRRAYDTTGRPCRGWLRSRHPWISRTCLSLIHI